MAYGHADLLITLHHPLLACISLVHYDGSPGRCVSQGGLTQLLGDADLDDGGSQSIPVTRIFNLQRRNGTLRCVRLLVETNARLIPNGYISLYVTDKFCNVLMTFSLTTLKVAFLNCRWNHNQISTTLT